MQTSTATFPVGTNTADEVFLSPSSALLIGASLVGGTWVTGTTPEVQVICDFTKFSMLGHAPQLSATPSQRNTRRISEGV